MLDAPAPCAELIADLGAIVGRASDTQTLLSGVRGRLADVGTERRWLLDRRAPVQPGTYDQQLLYVAPDRRFSVVAMTWGPGARTSIHDHAGWCAVAVYDGEEEETRYRLWEDAGRTYLIETGRDTLTPGAPVALAADGRDIHRVANRGRSTTRSLHVYGVDIEALGSSIKTRYDRLAIRA